MLVRPQATCLHVRQGRRGCVGSALVFNFNDAHSAEKTSPLFKRVRTFSRVTSDIAGASTSGSSPKREKNRRKTAPAASTSDRIGVPDTRVAEDGGIMLIVPLPSQGAQAEVPGTVVSGSQRRVPAVTCTRASQAARGCFASELGSRAVFPCFCHDSLSTSASCACPL